MPHAGVNDSGHCRTDILLITTRVQIGQANAVESVARDSVRAGMVPARGWEPGESPVRPVRWDEAVWLATSPLASATPPGTTSVLHQPALPNDVCGLLLRERLASTSSLVALDSDWSRGRRASRALNREPAGRTQTPTPRGGLRRTFAGSRWRSARTFWRPSKPAGSGAAPPLSRSTAVM